MPVKKMPPTTAAVAGAACISSSAVLMRLAGTSPSLTALGRCAFAFPVLAVLAWLERRRGVPPLAARSRWLARLAGVFLAADLILWSHAITAVGAGLGTVVTNLQVLIVSLLAWLILGERPRHSLLLASPVMLAGLALVGGLAGSRAYGTDPSLGVVYGVGVAVLYSIYILMLRQATATGGVPPGPDPSAGTDPSGGTGSPGGTGSLAGDRPRTAVAAVLFEATAGAVAGSVVLGLALRDFHLGDGSVTWAALGWLALLALTSQVIGWLLITVSMPRLPASMIGVLLLVQPAGSVALSYVILGERPSALQLLGVAMVLAGVLIAVSGRPVAGAADVEVADAGMADAGAADVGVADAGMGYERRRTRIRRHASVASTGRSASKSP